MKKSLCCIAILLTVVVAEARPKKSYSTIKETKSKYWDKIELIELKSKKIPNEAYYELSERKEEELIKAFEGHKKPSLRQSLLHHKAPAIEKTADKKDGKGKNKRKNDDQKISRERKNPVLLVHGAMVNANTSFADNCYHTAGRTGMATYLSRAGYKVYAITFAHPHGDNDTQAEHVAAAIERIKELTHSKKVDVIAHSKGTVSVRQYAGSVRAHAKKFTKYRKDIGRMILIGGPQGGLDINFAYPNLNYLIIAEKFDAPVVWTKAIVNYVWTDFKLQGLTGPASGYRGQTQMLARFDQIYGMIRIKGQFDVESTYNGGTGQVSISPGIDNAIKEGGNLIKKLKKVGVHRDIEVALLAGCHFKILGYLGERRGPSDGVVLVRSALDESAVTAKGAKVIRKAALPMNHLELTFKKLAMDWILEVLDRP